MQHIERPSEVPRVLLSKAAAAARERMLQFWELEGQRRAQTSVPPPGLGAEDEGLITALSAMSNGRCAFCEAEDRLFVHRHRPTGNALPLSGGSNGHLYYLWLTDAWQNLHPICRGCIPQEPQFPVSGSRVALPSRRQVRNYVERGSALWPSFPPKEDALLLDPTADQALENHLVPKLDGELIGGSRRGETTIIVHDLNRGDRRNQRYQAYHQRIDRLRETITAPPGVRKDSDWEDLFNFAKMEFGGTWYLLLRRVARWIAGSLDVGWRASRRQIRNFYDRLSAIENARELLEAALGALSREDEGLRAGRWMLGEIYSLRTPIASVKIENFKAIEALSLTLKPPSPGLDDPLAPFAPSLAILGENATGKSSILEAVALAVMSAQARRSLNPSWSKMVLDPTQLGVERAGSRRRARIQVTLESGQSVTLDIDQGSPAVRSEFGNQQMPIFAYGAFRRFGPGTRRSAPHTFVRNLFDGSALSNPEPWLKSLPGDTFNLVVRTLRDLLSVEGDFDVVQRVRGHLRMVTSLIEPGGTVRYSRTPLQAVSSGYRSMLGMICDIMRGLLDPQVYEKFESFQTAQGVVLIDEIEAHLHPRWKVQVMTSLRRALPGMTFIVTTHDPLCLRGMGEDEVMVLQRVATSDAAQESQMPILVERMTDLPSVADLRVEQLLTSDFFQLLSSDDAASDRKLARIGDLIAARDRGALAPADAGVLAAFNRDIASALPVGSSEVHRMVQEAVADYLAKRREASSATLRSLRQKAKDEILRALELL